MTVLDEIAHRSGKSVAEVHSALEHASQLSPEEQQRAWRGIVAVEFDAQMLPAFIDFLNQAHIIKDGYLLTFDARYFNEASATIYVTQHQMVT